VCQIWVVAAERLLPQRERRLRLGQRLLKVPHVQVYERLQVQRGRHLGALRLRRARRAQRLAALRHLQRLRQLLAQAQHVAERLQRDGHHRVAGAHVLQVLRQR
jgi:hypothetical protein